MCNYKTIQSGKCLVIGNVKRYFHGLLQIDLKKGRLFSIFSNNVSKMCRFRNYLSIGFKFIKQNAVFLLATSRCLLHRSAIFEKQIKATK